MTNTNDGDEPLDPASMLALAQKQQNSISASRGSFVSIIMTGYGVALLIGFLALRFIAGALAWWIFVALFAAAIALSITLGVRGARGIRSSDGFTGTAYGISWSLAMAGLGVLGGGLVNQGLGGHLLLLFYSCAYTLLIGVQYFMAGVIWRSVPSLIVGAWVVVVAGVAPYLGFPNHYLLLGLGAGGAFLALAVFTVMRTRAARLATNG